MLNTLSAAVERPWVSLLVGTALAIYGIIISLRSAVRRRLSYVIADSVILGVNNPTWHNELEIKYRGVTVQQLTACRIGIWNSGNTTIHGSQIVEADALRVQVTSSDTLLVTSLVGVSREILNVSVCPVDDTSAKISFDYLDPGDGFVIHTAQSASQGKTAISGSIRELSQGATPWSSRIVGGKWSVVFELGIGPLASTLIMALSSLLRKALGLVENSRASLTLSVVTLILVIVSLTASGALWKQFRLAKARRIPKVVRDDPSIDAHIKLGLV